MTATAEEGRFPHDFADSRRHLRHVFVHALRLSFRSGSRPEPPRPIAVDIDLAVNEATPESIGDDIRNVVCYDEIAQTARRLAMLSWPDLRSFGVALSKRVLANDQIREAQITLRGTGDDRAVLVTQSAAPVAHQPMERAFGG